MCSSRYAYDRTTVEHYDAPSDGCRFVTLIFLAPLLTAGVLGVTHAIEPDHVAGISSLTSRFESPRLSAAVGACFSLGHAALVVAWLAIGYFVFGRTRYPAVFDTVGTVVVALVLGAIGALMTVRGLRSLYHVYQHSHAHDGVAHGHTHTHTDHEDHDHTAGTYLKTSLTGALFTLSPPLSMIVFASSLFSEYGGRTVALAVIVYTVAITATMSAIGAGVGSVVAHTDRASRSYHIARAAGGLLIFALALSLVVGSFPS
jgi:ABC-type nickel/cobalt efflux system permease component RcnA